MFCPFCDCMETRVLESRSTEEGKSIRRRRECTSCGERFTTYERAERLPIFVIKKDGRREAFDSQKVLKGLVTACEKRPVPLDRLRQLVNEVEFNLVNRMETEVPAAVIGELVMDKLKEVDDVAYVRFASVYREFKDIQMFMDELEMILRKKDG